MHFKLLRLLSFSLLLSVLTPALHAQTTCNYTLVMRDIWGDGWNGGFMDITSGADSYTFSLATGFVDTVTFEINAGEPLIIEWTNVAYLGEIGYQLLNNVGTTVSFAAAPLMPPSGVLYTGVGECVTCSKPANVSLDNVWDTYAKLRWTTDPNGPSPAQRYLVIYGPQGFDPSVAGAGDTATTTQQKITLTGLQKKTWYDAYVVQDCGLTDGYSSLAGPVTFETYWTKDVGIAGIVAPLSGCDLGLDTVKVLLKNYGAAPQSLIPFRYTVNGEEVNIPKPADGFYTGVLGKDSSEVVFFETVFDFSEPGEYVIVAYTKFTGDEDLANDTFTYRFNNYLLSPYTQNFEDWNGGWSTTGDNNLSSWAYGTPDKAGIPTVAVGQNAWVTNLTAPYLPSEMSYLESPCFDFTELGYDPVITFSIAHLIESGYDGAWLEVSTDDGANWQKVGAINEGLNWYNEDVQNSPQIGEAWSGNSNGWQTARHFLTGTAGESRVKFRFAFASDQSAQLAGAAIDDVRIFPAFSKDLIGVRVNAESEQLECGLDDDLVTFTFLNAGNLEQSDFKVAYSINGGTPVIEDYNGGISPDGVLSYTFDATFNSVDAISVIKCWTILGGEFAPANDTATITINHLPRPAPFQENFESQIIPAGWLTDGFVTNAHGNISFVLASNLYSFNPDFTHELPRYGLIGAGDSLAFSYRVIDFVTGGPIALPLGSKIELQVSTDCGETYTTINTVNSTNHTPTLNLRTRTISLAQYAGQAVKFRFLGTWTSGDFWVDLDNINLLSCAADMALTANVTPASPGQSNGVATVQVGLGNPPFIYNWSNGATTQTVEGLSTGTYSVTVNDAFGCSDSFEFSVGTSAVTSIDGLTAFNIQPNPTNGQVVLKVMLEENAADLQVAVLNLLGQVIWEANASNTNQLLEQIDLSSAPDGMYLLRLTADGQVATKKVIKNR